MAAGDRSRPDRSDRRHRARPARCDAAGAGAALELPGAGNGGGDAGRRPAKDAACDAVAFARGRDWPNARARPTRQSTGCGRQSRGRNGSAAAWPAHPSGRGWRCTRRTPPQLMGRIRVGISSWTEPTLIKSGWYPADVTSAEDRLRYYASKFPVVEVDSTFYAMPNQKTAQLWVERTPKDFTFNAKAYALLTQHPTPPARLPKALRETLSDAKANVYFKDLGPKERESIWDRFREGLQPLQDAGKLGAVVFQFPKWFLPSQSAYRFMEDLREGLPAFGIAIEFRRKLWRVEERPAPVPEFPEHDRSTQAVAARPAA